MGLTKVNGQMFKQLLFSNNRIKATTYDGLVVYIPIKVLSDMIYQTLFDVVDGKEIEVVDFSFQPKKERVK